MPIPQGWGARLHEMADLEASCEELREMRCYDGESLRGRVRSLQMRLQEADRCFARAARILAANPETAEPMQVALTSVYEREHAMLKGTQAPRRAYKAIAVADEKARTIASLHDSIDGLELLEDGEPERAHAIFVRLLEENDQAGHERKGLWNLALGACEIGRDDIEEAHRRLEVAGLHACNPGCRALGQSQMSAWLVHVYAFLDERAAAREWIAFHGRVRCPDATKQAMRRRAELLSRRSLRLGRCVLC